SAVRSVADFTAPRRTSIHAPTTRRWRTPAETSPTKRTSGRSMPRCWMAGWEPTQPPFSAGTSAPPPPRLFNLPGPKGPGLPYDPPMKKLWTAAAAAVCLMTFLHAQPRAQKDGEEAKRLHEAATIFDEIMAAQDKAIPTAILG